MEHYAGGIQGWFSWHRLTERMVREAEPGAVFVEVGCWKGKSTCYAGVEIVNSGKLITLYAVDPLEPETWVPAAGWQDHTRALAATPPERVRAELVRNIEPVKSVVRYLSMRSVDAARLFGDQSVDWVMVDGDHSYEAVREDITAWLPKVKRGGVLSGDDYADKFPGVVRAIGELLPGAVRDGVRQWLYRVPA